MVED
ncbi:hypothetical protein LINGRAHAP2_LOCUS11173 [Linum grandiflorum]|jgi:hypothetical protein